MNKEHEALRDAVKELFTTGAVMLMMNDCNRIQLEFQLVPFNVAIQEKYIISGDLSIKKAPLTDNERGKQKDVINLN